MDGRALHDPLDGRAYDGEEARPAAEPKNGLDERAEVKGARPSAVRPGGSIAGGYFLRNRTTLYESVPSTMRS